MTFSERVEDKRKQCERILEEFLPAETGYPALVAKAMNYSVRAGGKRLRPMLMMTTGQMYGADESVLAPFMAALEMIHTYSLVHDDLPAMDNDEYRRGRKTTWAVYGDGMAVLAGDGLLNYAYETALKAFDAPAAADPEIGARVVRSLKVLAANAGLSGMVGGQCADIEAEQEADRVAGMTGAEKEALLFYIHENKTAAMIRSGFQIGAILGGAPDRDITLLGEIADAVGLAFQIQDDILDVTGSMEQLGKSIGKDAESGKITYTALHGIDGAAGKVDELTQSAVSKMEEMSVQDDFLKALVLSLVGRES